QTKLEALRLGKQALENNRRELLSRNESDALNFYSDFNYELLLGIANLQSLSSNVQQARAYADLAALLRIQELAVRERGLINGMLLKRQFDTDSYEQLLALITEQDQSIDLFRASAIAEHKQRLEAMLLDSKSQTLNNVREQLRQQDAITRQAHKF
ncbi:nitrate- and nitrite sensing domain-containing protein, partial [Shewanella indica]